MQTKYSTGHAQETQQANSEKLSRADVAFIVCEASLSIGLLALTHWAIAL
jgi:hypothetical protein